MEEQFKQVEDMFLGYLQEEAAKIDAEFENVVCRGYASGSAEDQEFRFWDIYIDCVLLKVEGDNADNVCLGVNSQIEDGEFVIDAQVGWGHPSGYIEMRVFNEWAPLNEENLLRIKEKLPELVLKLRDVLKAHPDGK